MIRILQRSLPILFILLVWQIYVDINPSIGTLFPSPFRVAIAIKEWAVSGELWIDFVASVWRALVGLLIGSIIGIFFGLLTGRSVFFQHILAPILNILKAFPPVAMLPIFITFLGIGDFSKIFSIAFATIFPLWVNTHIGASHIPIEFIRSAKLLTKSHLKIFVRVVLPATTRAIMAGFRIGIAISFIMLYVSELAGASHGLGYQIASSHLAYRIDKMLGALIVLGATASVVDFFFNKTILYLFPWISFDKNI